MVNDGQDLPSTEVSDSGTAEPNEADAGAADAGTTDAGTTDAGTTDTGTTDTGTTDTGTTDTGTADGKPSGEDLGDVDGAHRAKAADTLEAGLHEANAIQGANTIEGAPMDGGETTDRPSIVERIRSADRVELVIATAIALLLVIFAWGVSLGVSGEDRYRLPDLVESVVPVPDALQTEPTSAIVVDLDDGFTGVLTVDGVELETVNIDEIRSEPGQQLELPPVTIYEPGNSTLTFRPQAGSQIERWSPGDHVAKVTYWKVTDGEFTARNFTWQFRVT